MPMPDPHLLLPPAEELDRPLVTHLQGERPPISIQPARREDLRYYVNVILRRKWLIFSIIIISTTYVALREARRIPLYGATTTVRIEPPSNDLPQENINVGYIYRGPEYWNTQLRMLQSPPLMRQVALRLNLPNDPSFLAQPKSPGLFDTLRHVFSKAAQTAPAMEVGVPVVTDAGSGDSQTIGAADADKLSAEQMARLSPYVGALLAKLSVQQIKDTNLIEISFTHSSPDVAMRVANAVAEVFINDEFERETAGTHNAVTKLSQELASMQTQIKGLEEQRIVEMKSKDLPLGQAKGQDLTAARLGTLSDQLLAAENERKQLQAAYEQAMKTADVWSIPQVNESPDVQEGRKELRRLDQQRAAKLKRYTESWPEMIDLDSQIKEITEKIDRAAHEAVGVMKARYEAAQEREQKVRGAYESERAAANHKSQDEIMMSSLNQEISTSKGLYSTLIQRQKELEILSNRKASNITIMSPASLPDSPLPHNPLRALLIALGLSMFLSAGLIFVLEQCETNLKTAEDVLLHLQLPTLAEVPAPERRSMRVRLSADTGTDSTALTLAKDLRSAVAEAYRQLRTSLLLTPAGGAPKSILVTSAQPGDGKTTTAINAAIAFAQQSAEAHAGAEVLLIDCDLRRPRIHEHFKLPNTKGVTTFLTGQADLDSLLHSYGELPTLHLLPSGPLPANPADLLGSYGMGKLLDLAGRRFKYIIIDSPPAGSFADAALLSTVVEGVVLVVNCESSSRAAVWRIKQRMLDVRAHIFGVVLNYSKLTSDSYYGSYYSDYYSKEDERVDSAAQAGRLIDHTGGE